jgi:hypothetical protein
MKMATSKIALLLVIGLFILNITSYSQGKVNNKETFLEAESFFLHEEFSEALPLYVQLKETSPWNYNLDYRIGRCYIAMPSEKMKAIAYLEKAVKHVTKDYTEGKFSEEMAPQDAIFYLGDAYRINNQLEKAIATYKLFKTKASSKTYDLKLLNNQIESCQRAIEAIKKPIDVDKTNLGKDINTRYSETNPVVTPNEDVLVYATKLPFYDALFYTRKIDGQWTKPINIIPELGVDGDCFPTCISYDGNELFLYRSNDYRGDIYVTNYKNGKWSKIRKLNNNINTKYWEAHASLSRDGKTLYFSSNRDGGFGGLDLYKSERTDGENWGPAVNLGSVINTRYNEDTPFILLDGKRLYYSSDGHESIGGYDIFYSDLSPKGVWLKSKNLGYPVNTTDDDLFYCPIRDGSIAYMAVYEPNGFGRFDIVRLNVHTYDNPRKYQIIGTAKLQLSSGQTPVFYLALFDKNKNDTVLRRRITGEKISFEAEPGQYDVYVYSEQNQFQKQPLTIAWGSTDVNRSLNFELTRQKEESIKNVIAVAPNSEQKLGNDGNTSNQSKLNLLADLKNGDSKIENTDSIEITNSTKIDSVNKLSDHDSALLTQVNNLKATSAGNNIDIGSKDNNLLDQVKFWIIANKALDAFIGLLILWVIVWFLIKKKKKKEN